MSDVEPNPYAPPAVAIDVRVSEAPLPPGVRRFRLDPARFDRFNRVITLQLASIAIPILAVWCGFMGWATGLSPSYLGLLLVLAIAWIFVARTVRVRMSRKSNLASYELLVSDRVARRNLAGWVSAEVLRPEVTEIVEVPTGLWLRCAQPPRALFVAKAIDGYEDARAILTSWAPVRVDGGFSAWRMTRTEGRNQRPRNEALGILATDRSMVEELETVRNASRTATLEKPPSRAATYGRLAVVWFALVLVFLGLWQFFAPSGPS